MRGGIVAVGLRLPRRCGCGGREVGGGGKLSEGKKIIGSDGFHWELERKDILMDQQHKIISLNIESIPFSPSPPIFSHKTNP